MSVYDSTLFFVSAACKLHHKQGVGCFGEYLFFAQSGLKCTVRQMAPPRYIFAVLPSRDGILISGAVVGYVAGISNSKSNSYLINSWTYQHFPDHCVPSLLDVIVNQSESVLLLICIYLMRACNSCTERRPMYSLLKRTEGCVM